MRVKFFMRRWGGRIGAVAVGALVAMSACGATKHHTPPPAKAAKADKEGGAPLAPTVYDPRVSLAPLVKKVSPAVVNIRTAAKVPAFRGPWGPDSLFEFFFGPRPRRMPQVPESIQRAMGSGFIIRSDGLVVTNHHVIDGADEIEVTLDDDRTFSATVVGSDERTDVALLKLKNAKNLPTVQWGDSDTLQVGDHVVAIGNPFGLDHTVTSGIVSAKERVIGAGPYDDFIQTDASINPGNSGGPLFNLEGLVVGINTAIARSGQGIGFAIPSNLAKSVIESIQRHGKVVRGWLGVGFQPLDEELAKALGADVHGALITQVVPGSPAEKAGLQARDVIVAVNGKALHGARQLPAVVAALQPGTKATVTIVRKGQKKKVTVTIGKAGEDGGLAADDGGAEATRLGIAVQPLTDALRQRLDAASLDYGVVVTEVASDSPLAALVREGDVLLEINDIAMKDVAAFEKAVSSLRKGQQVILRLYRNGAFRFIATTL